MITPKQFKYKELTHEILNAAFEVHNILGCGFLEKVYEKALAYELKLRGLSVETQKEKKVYYKKFDVGLYISDMVIENKIIVELKTVEAISNIHEAQLLNYLKVSGYEVGLILNFANTKLEYKRLVM
jgi:GxxExxY protein